MKQDHYFLSKKSRKHCPIKSYTQIFTNPISNDIIKSKSTYYYSLIKKAAASVGEKNKKDFTDFHPLANY